MQHTGYESKQRQQAVDPKILTNAKLHVDCDRRDDKCDQQAYVVHGSFSLILSFNLFRFQFFGAPQRTMQTGYPSAASAAI
jgi:hypothetical protein